ncbi:hypothetical protein GCM10009557_03780 [Virgisporangium ochraceum]|uniref:Uncharacterized protein n=1 Tax=Virgisporangium ochraceum TaxID=65505 RepID=A0A8J4A231_9ACTN|nr:hypothetical protein [Virgisporangium ochraceum]GIJ72743.1 hypothetical protein Voc01_076600 [Virgisporangium ochraceum]
MIAALAARLPDPLLATAVDTVAGLGRYDSPGRAMAALAPRLSGGLLRTAVGITRGFDELADYVQASNELALRHPPAARHQILLGSLRRVEGRPVWTLELRRAFVRLVELLPAQLVPRALGSPRRCRRATARPPCSPRWAPV